MAKLDYFTVEVKYSGNFDDYTPEQFKAMADAKVGRGCDPFNHSETVTDERAEKYDGRVWVCNKFPSNKLAIVNWCYKSDEVEE